MFTRLVPRFSALWQPNFSKINMLLDHPMVHCELRKTNLAIRAAQWTCNYKCTSSLLLLPLPASISTRASRETTTTCFVPHFSAFWQPKFSEVNMMLDHPTVRCELSKPNLVIRAAQGTCIYKCTSSLLLHVKGGPWRVLSNKISTASKYGFQDRHN